MKSIFCVCGIVFMLIIWSVNGMAMASGGRSSLPQSADSSADWIQDRIEPTGQWSPDPPVRGPAWTTLKYRTAANFSSDAGAAIPVVMMAGYMDTDISWRYGGTFKMLAWVIDPDQDVVSVEICFEGEPTGVMLLDDGLHGDFSAGDGLYGLMAEIPERTVEPGEFVLELMATDSLGNQSDLWPYLTIHN